MQIVLTLTFDNADELDQYLIGRGKKKAKADLVPLEDVAEAIKAEELNKSAQKTSDIINKAEAKIEAEAKADKPKPAPKQADKPEVDESYRVEVRKVLAALNKKTGENTASKLIKELGKEKLTEVALSDLPGLMAKAQEQLDA